MSPSHMDGKTTVRELMESVARFRDSRDWKKYDTPRNLAGSICIEAAELLEHFQWKTDEQATEMLRNPEELVKISNELADVIIYCLGFSDTLGLDVSKAVQRKLKRNAEKCPAATKDLQLDTAPLEIPLKGTPFSEPRSFVQQSSPAYPL